MKILFLWPTKKSIMCFQIARFTIKISVCALNTFHQIMSDSVEICHSLEVFLYKMDMWNFFRSEIDGGLILMCLSCVFLTHQTSWNSKKCFVSETQNRLLVFSTDIRNFSFSAIYAKMCIFWVNIRYILAVLPNISYILVKLKIKKVLSRIGKN